MARMTNGARHGGPVASTTEFVVDVFDAPVPARDSGE